MSDAFTQYALNHSPRPVAKKIRRALDRPVYVPATAAERKQHEDGQLAAAYKRAIKGDEAWLLASPAGPYVQGLILFLDDANLECADDFLKQLATCEPLRKLPKDARFIALRMLDRAVQRLRERNGLNFCDDHLDFEQPTIMQTLKREMEL